MAVSDTINLSACPAGSCRSHSRFRYTPARTREEFPGSDVDDPWVRAVAGHDGRYSMELCSAKVSRDVAVCLGSNRTGSGWADPCVRAVAVGPGRAPVPLPLLGP